MSVQNLHWRLQRGTRQVKDRLFWVRLARTSAWWANFTDQVSSRKTCMLFSQLFTMCACSFVTGYAWKSRIRVDGQKRSVMRLRVDAETFENGKRSLKSIRIRVDGAFVGAVTDPDYNHSSGGLLGGCFGTYTRRLPKENSTMTLVRERISIRLPGEWGGARHTWSRGSYLGVEKSEEDVVRGGLGTPLQDLRQKLVLSKGRRESTGERLLSRPAITGIGLVLHVSLL